MPSSRLLLLLAAASGLLLFGTGCSQVSSLLSKEASNAVQAVDGALVNEVQAAEPTENPAESETPTPSVTALQRSEEIAAVAAAAAEEAVTATEWNRVTNQWKAAIAYAASVPEEADDHAVAQAKALGYKGKLDEAQAEYSALVQKRYQVFTDSPVNNAGASDTYEADGKQVRTWLRNGEFEKVESLLKSAVQAKKFTRGGAYYADSVLKFALGGDDVVFSPALIKQLNQWVEKSPNSAYPYIIRAYATQSFSWAKPYLYERGADGQASNPRQINEQDAEALGKPLFFSALDTERALQLDPNNPLLRLAELRLARTFAIATADESMMDEYFNKVEQVLPFSLEGHFEKMIYLLNQDNTGGEALKFLRSRVDGVPSDSPLPILLAVTHFAVLDEQANSREYLNQPEVWQEIQTVSEKTIAAFPQEGLYAAWYAFLADEAEKSDIARRYSQIAISSDASGVELQTWLQIMN